LIKKVLALHRLLPDVTQGLLDSVDQISKRFFSLYPQFPSKVETEDEIEKLIEIESQFELLMSINHNILNALGVGHPVIDNIVNLTAKYHLYTKITGAGGGGCVYTLVKSNLNKSIINEVLEELNKCGYENITVDLGVEGVKLHNNLNDLPFSYN